MWQYSTKLETLWEPRNNFIRIFKPLFSTKLETDQKVMCATSPTCQSYIIAEL